LQFLSVVLPVMSIVLPVMTYQKKGVVLLVMSILIHNITSIILISGTYCHYCDLTWEDLIVTAHIIYGGFARQKSQHSASKV
jgi:hypothetical protein